MSTDSGEIDAQVFAELQFAIGLDDIRALPADPTIPHVLLDASPDRTLPPLEARKLYRRRRVLYDVWLAELAARFPEPERRWDLLRLAGIGWLRSAGFDFKESAVNIVRRMATEPGCSAAASSALSEPPTFALQIEEALTADDRHTYFRVLRKASARGKRVLRHQRLKTRSCSLEVCIRQEAEFRYLIWRMTLNGILHFAGIPRARTVLPSAMRAAALAGEA